MTNVTDFDSSVYYKEQYWDSFPQATRYIQHQATGFKTKDSLIDFKERFAQKPFKHGLFLNCGNGWLERWFINHGMVIKATSFDYSESLIAEANRKKGKLPITYFTADANKIELPENTYDLVVNSAALHHVQFLNRFCYQILKSMKDNGIFFHYDYIGPHRNQYSAKHWQMINDVNNALPKSIKKDPLSYAHLPTMMVSDPSEAIHSELIMEMVGRYFKIEEQHDISGMIAYNLLSLNSKLKRKDQNKYIENILKKDKQAFAMGEIPPLFTYMITRPNKAVLQNKQQLKKWQLEENLREKNSQIIEWTYSVPEYMKLVEHSQKQKRFMRLGLYIITKTLSTLYFSIASVFLSLSA